MPTPEGPGGRPRNPGRHERSLKAQEPGEPNKEIVQPPYSKAARFGGDKKAGMAYFEAQEVIFSDTESELSAYRLMLNAVYHVAVLGEQPSEETDHAITQILSQGRFVALPSEVIAALNARRLEMKRHGSWVEGHYRAGKEIDL
jgi:hypothetical protein